MTKTHLQGILIKSVARVTDEWKFSSAGRASALQAEGHRFEPYRFHSNFGWSYGEIAQLARACGSYPQCRGFESPSRYFKMPINRASFLFVLHFGIFSVCVAQVSFLLAVCSLLECDMNDFSNLLFTVHPRSPPVSSPFSACCWCS